MMSLLSILLVLSVKSLEISAKDYYELRVMVNAIPPDPYAPHLLPYALENKLDSVVFRLSQVPVVQDIFNVDRDTLAEKFEPVEMLENAGNEEELNNLLLHASPIVKVYAYRTLLINEMNMNCDYELLLLEDTTCVGYLTSDRVVNSTVKDLVQNDLRMYRGF
jgi:hypothetical protein